MAYVRRSINTSFWSDEFNETLTPLEKYFFLYLLTNPYTNMCGVYKLGIKRICFETGMTEKEVNHAFQSLSKGFKAFYIIPDGYVILRKFIKNQSYNANMKTAVFNQINELPNNIKELFFSYVMDLEALEKHLNNSEAFESLLKPLKPVKETEYEYEYESEMESEFKSKSENEFECKGLTPDKPTAKKTVFIKPTESECINYFSEKSQAGIEASKFFNYYESNGWMVGKNKMKNWKAAASNWISNIKQSEPEIKKTYTDAEIIQIVKKKNPKVHLGYLEESIRLANISFRDQQHKLNTWLSFSEKPDCQVRS